MTYATQQDLIDRFGETELIQISDRTNSGTIGGEEVAKALADADGEINAHLRVRYTLPLASVPTFLVLLACNIARYRLYEPRTTEEVEKRYKSAVDSLKSLADGSMQLGDAGSATPGGEIIGGAILDECNPPRVFGRTRG